MELIPISESKLKIMLDESDMKEYHIGDEADCADGETRVAIRHILEKARDRIGFNTEGSEIFVKLYTSKRGGCELFVTKSSPCTSYEEPKQSDKKSKKGKKDECRALWVRGDAQMSDEKSGFGRMIFSFETLGDLCRVCKVRLHSSLSRHSRAYKGEDDGFYLVLDNTNCAAYTRLDKLTFILEFGSRERTDHLTTYLCEHATPICEGDAISLLANF